MSGAISGRNDCFNFCMKESDGFSLKLTLRRNGANNKLGWLGASYPAVVCIAICGFHQSQASSA